MEYEAGHHEKTHFDEQPRCPVCRAVLTVELLELEDEPETLLLLDCPEDHIHATLTHQDIMAVLSAEVGKRLGF